MLLAPPLPACTRGLVPPCPAHAQSQCPLPMPHYLQSVPRLLQFDYRRNCNIILHKPKLRGWNCSVATDDVLSACRMVLPAPETRCRHRRRWPGAGRPAAAVEVWCGEVCGGGGLVRGGLRRRRWPGAVRPAAAAGGWRHQDGERAGHLTPWKYAARAPICIT